MMYCEIHDINITACAYEPCEKCPRLSTYRAMQDTLESGAKDMVKRDNARKYFKGKGRPKWVK